MAKYPEPMVTISLAEYQHLKDNQMKDFALLYAQWGEQMTGIQLGVKAGEYLDSSHGGMIVLGTLLIKGMTPEEFFKQHNLYIAKKETK